MKKRQKKKNRKKQLIKLDCIQYEIDELLEKIMFNQNMFGQCWIKVGPTMGGMSQDPIGINIVEWQEMMDYEQTSKEKTS